MTYRHNRAYLIGSNERAVTVTYDGLAKMSQENALKDPTFSAAYTLRNQMSARRDIVETLAAELEKQYREKTIAPADYVERLNKAEALIDAYNSDIAEMNVALAAALSDVRTETLKALIDQGYELPQEWLKQAGLSGVVVLTIAAVALIAAMTAGIAVAAPKISEIFAAKEKIELEREKVAAELAKTVLEKAPEGEKVKFLEAIGKGRPPRIRAWYEYLFWTALAGATALTAVKLAPMAIKPRRKK